MRWWAGNESSAVAAHAFESIASGTTVCPAKLPAGGRRPALSVSRAPTALPTQEETPAPFPAAALLLLVLVAILRRPQR